MHQILPLRGVIQHYDWGSRTALAALLGRPGPSERPEAELWLGAHPKAPAEAWVEGRWEVLDGLISREREALLGAAAITAFGPRLPFLMKVLAVERPLSLQVHPDADQARAGFARMQREGQSGIYVDPHGKPELICALTRFTALCGLRPLPEVRARFAPIGLGGLLRDDQDEAAALARLLGVWLAAPHAMRREPLRRALEQAERCAPADADSVCLIALAAAYPDDPGVLAPYFLNRIELAPGEALYLPPGELHCYLAGTAIELMASSDNVIRGGLTTKHMAIDELLRVARFASRRPPILRAEQRGSGESVWRTPAVEFELSSLQPDTGRPLLVAARRGGEVLWYRATSKTDPLTT